jgi:spoIIIJ-associated protein
MTGEDQRAEDAPMAEEMEPAEALEELLEEIVEGLGLDVLVDAVQHLAQRIVFPGGPSPVRVVIDADGYRERRSELLRADADDAAEEALRSGRAVELAPMPPAERRIVHEYLRERGGVETHSEGEEPDRSLIVSPADD